MTADAFRQVALAIDGAVEGAHMGHPDFRASAKGRIFASLSADGASGMVKLMPEQQREMIAAHPAAFTPASGAWGRQGCTMVRLDEAGVRVVTRAMRMAWENVATEPAPAARKRNATTRGGRASSRKKTR